MGGFSTLVGAPPFIDICVSVDAAQSPYDVSPTDNTIFCEADDGDIIINLPEAWSNEGRTFSIKKIDTTDHIVTIEGHDAETIDNQPSLVISVPYDSFTISAEEGKWWIL